MGVRLACLDPFLLQLLVSHCWLLPVPASSPLLSLSITPVSVLSSVSFSSYHTPVTRSPPPIKAENFGIARLVRTAPHSPRPPSTYVRIPSLSSASQFLCRSSRLTATALD